jgi:hypothetical protein
MILGFPKRPLPGPKPPLGRQKPSSLAEWLDQAIGDLVPSAQARVRAEIEAHYTEAVQANLQTGLSESAAQASALADLGDAPVAARRFSREHLTIREAKGIGARAKTNPWVFGLIIQSFIWVMVWVYGKPAQLRFLIIAVVALALVLANISLASVEKALAQRKPTMATRRQNVLLETIKLPMDMIPLMLNVVALIMLFKADQHLDTVQYYLSWCFFASLGVSLLVYLISTVSLTLIKLRLRQKLVTAHEDDFPANPPDAAT